jgi:hypothetical protein
VKFVEFVVKLVEYLEKLVEFVVKFVEYIEKLVEFVVKFLVKFVEFVVCKTAPLPRDFNVVLKT